MPSSPSPIITSTRPNDKKPIKIKSSSSLSWVGPNSLHFTFYVTHKHKYQEIFFFFNFEKYISSSLWHVSMYSTITWKQKIFPFFNYQSSPFLFPQKVNKKKTHTLFHLNLVSPSSLSTSLARTLKTVHNVWKNQKPKTLCNSY